MTDPTREQILEAIQHAYTPTMAADVVHCSRRTVYYAIERGELPAVSHPAGTLIMGPDLRAWAKMHNYPVDPAVYALSATDEVLEDVLKNAMKTTSNAGKK